MTISFSVMAVSAGQTYDLNDRAGLFLMAYNMGTSGIRRLTQRAPAQLGETDVGFTVEPRFIDMAWVIRGASLDDYYDIRERLLTIFRPRDNAPVQVIFEFAGNRRRAVDVYLDGSFGFGQRRHTSEEVSAVFRAADPRLYDPDQNTVTFLPITSSDGWEIDWEIDWSIGASSVAGMTTITYAGGSRLAAVEYPIIAVTGPITNPVITNVTTNEKIDLTGLSLAPGQTVTIDLSGGMRRDYKSIRNADGVSLAQYLSTDSDLATWHLSYAGELLYDGTYSTGDNDIRLTGSNGTMATQLQLSYYNRYEGI